MVRTSSGTRTIAGTLLLVLLLLVSVAASAQAKVYGTVADAGNQPLSNATVLLLKAADSSLVKASFTSLGGQYSFEKIAPGSYLISTSYTGFRPQYSALFALAADDYPVPLLLLTEKEGQMKEVVVATKKPLFEQRIDRMVINVASSITNAGTTALDVLKRSPGVTVDEQNNSLSINGKDGVVVMLNGKINRMPLASVMQLLAGMNSSNIERIELITTPPSNFDAEGNAGFINIVTKTSLQYGTNGSFSLTAGYGKKPVAAGSVNFNHRKERWNLFGDYSFSEMHLTNLMVLYRKVTQGSRVLESDMDTDRDAIRRSHNGRLGLDYELSRKTTVGVLLSAFYNLYKMDAVNTSFISVNGALDTTIIINNPEDHPLNNYAGNINLVHQFSEGKRLSLNLDYVYYKDANTVDYESRYHKGNGAFLYTELMRSLKTTPISFWVGSADQSWKVSEKVSLEAGLKATLSRFENDVQVDRKLTGDWVTDKELTARFNLKEYIYAGYTSLSARFNSRASVKLGVRYEYTSSNLGSLTQRNIVDRRYGNFFPTLFYSQGISENSSVNFSYARRITRPTFNNMAPFVYFVDPNTYFSGNPALQPTIANAFKTDYIVRRMIFSLSYTKEDNPITNFAPRVDPVTNKQTLAAENQKARQTAALTISLPVTVAAWWNMQNNINGYWQQLDAIYKGDPLQITVKNYDVSSTQTFLLPKAFTLELRGRYTSGGLFGILMMRGIGSMDIGLQKKFADNKSSLRLAVSDVFGPPVFKPSVNLPERNLVIRGALRFTDRIARLTYTRSFGNDKVKEKRARQVASEEERQRVNTN